MQGNLDTSQISGRYFRMLQGKQPGWSNLTLNPDWAKTVGLFDENSRERPRFIQGVGGGGGLKPGQFYPGNHAGWLPLMDAQDKYSSFNDWLKAYESGEYKYTPQPTPAERKAGAWQNNLDWFKTLPLSDWRNPLYVAPPPGPKRNVRSGRIDEDPPMATIANAYRGQPQMNDLLDD